MCSRSTSFILAVFCVLLSGCTSSLFTGDSSSDQKTRVAVTRNLNCEHLDLSNETLDAPTFRGLMNCLNSNSSLEGIASYVRTSDQSHIEALVDVLNKTILKNKTRIHSLKELFAVYHETELEKEWSDLLSEFLLKDDEAGLLTFFKNLIYDDNDKVSSDWIAVFQHFKRKLGEDDRQFRTGVLHLFENTYKIVSLNSWKASSQALTKPLSSSGLTAEELSVKLFEFLKAKSTDSVDTGRVLVEGLSDGSLQLGWNSFFRNTTYDGRTMSVDDQVHAFEQMIRVFNDDFSQGVLPSIQNLLAKHDRPISCLFGNVEIQNGSQFVLNEVATKKPEMLPLLFNTTELTLLKSAQSVCDLNITLQDYKAIDALTKFSERSDGSVIDKQPMITSGRLLQALQIADTNTKFGRNSAYTKLLIHLLGDVSEHSAVQEMRPLFQEWSDQDRRFVGQAMMLVDALLRNDSPVAEDVRRLFQIFVEPIPELGGRAAIDVLSSSLSNVSNESAQRLATGLTKWNENGSWNYEKIIQILNRSVLSTDRSPVLEVISEVLGDRHYLESMLDLSIYWQKLSLDASVKQELNKELQQGTLIDFIRAFLDVFDASRSDKNNTNLNKKYNALKPLPQKFQRTLNDIQAWNPIRPQWFSLNNEKVCKAVAETDRALLVSPIDVGAIKNALSCVKTQVNDDVLLEFIDHISTVTIKLGNVEHSLIELFSNFIGKVFFETNASNDPQARAAHTAFLSETFFSENFEGILRDIRFLASAVIGKQGSATVSIFDSFTNLIKSLSTEDRKSFDYLSETFSKLAFVDSGSSVKLSDNFSDTIDFSKDLRQMPKADPDKAAVPELLNRQQIESTLKEELIKNGYTKNLDKIISSKIDQYFYSSLADARDMRFQNTQDVLNVYQPFVQLMRKSHPDALNKLASFFVRIKSGEYSPEWVSQWIYRNASHVHVISYFEKGKLPGRDQPTVMLTNNLDLLEMIAREADFSLNSEHQNLGNVFTDPDVNFAIKYFAMLANSGQDLEGFLKEMRKDIRYYKNICDRFGFFVRDEIQRRITNLDVLLGVLEEMGGVHSGTRNDLGFLRDFFKEILDATPDAQKTIFEKEKNSLGVLVEFAQTGIFRLIGSQILTRDYSSMNSSELKVRDDTAALQFISELLTSKEKENDVVNPDGLLLLQELLLNDPSLKVLSSVIESYYRHFTVFESQQLFFQNLQFSLVAFSQIQHRNSLMPQANAKILAQVLASPQITDTVLMGIDYAFKAMAHDPFQLSKSKFLAESLRRSSHAAGFESFIGKLAVEFAFSDADEFSSAFSVLNKLLSDRFTPARDFRKSIMQVLHSADWTRFIDASKNEGIIAWIFNSEYFDDWSKSVLLQIYRETEAQSLWEVLDQYSHHSESFESLLQFFSKPEWIDAVQDFRDRSMPYLQVKTSRLPAQ